MGLSDTFIIVTALFTETMAGRSRNYSPKFLSYTNKIIFTAVPSRQWAISPVKTTKHLILFLLEKPTPYHIPLKHSFLLGLRDLVTNWVSTLVYKYLLQQVF